MEEKGPEPTKVWRSVKPRGDEVTRLRVEKGWRIEDLAKKAKCSPRTVSNIEHGENTYLSTLRSLAEALGTEFSTLIGDAIPQPPASDEPPDSWSRRVEIQLNMAVSINVTEPAQVNELIAMLLRFIGTQGTVVVKEVKEGSVIVTLEVSMEDLIRVAQAFTYGDLKELPLQRFTVLDAEALKGLKRFMPFMQHWGPDAPPGEEAKPGETDGGEPPSE